MGILAESYNFEEKDLIDVINELSKTDELERIRLSSFEITELNGKFLNILKDNKKFCDYLVGFQEETEEMFNKH